MSKKIIFFLMVAFSLGTLAFTSCGSDDDDAVELVLAKTDVIVEKGTAVTVKISKGNGGYVVKSLDESVATACLGMESNLILITGVGTGITRVDVSDAKGQTNSIKVSVPENAPAELDYADLIVGKYNGKLNITDFGIVNADNNIVLSKTGGNKTTLELGAVTFQLGGQPITIKNIAVDNVPVSLVSDNYKLVKTTETITVNTGVDATAKATVEGMITGNTLNLTIDLAEIAGIPQNLHITFVGDIVP